MIGICDSSVGCVERLRDDIECWDVSGEVTATARLGSRAVRQRAPVEGLLVLHSDGRYEIPQAGCPAGGGDVPTEVGTVRLGRRGRWLLEPENYEDVTGAAARCLDLENVRFPRRAIRQWIRIRTDGRPSCRWSEVPGDGDHLCGFSRVRGSVRTSAGRVSVKAVERVTGTRRRPPE